MDTLAIVMEQPGRLSLSRLNLPSLHDGDVAVDIAWSGISTGTERLFWQGRMPPFPGMGYPLVPGYESVGRVIAAGPNSAFADGDTVFVPGAACYGDIRGLFGGAASRVVVPEARLSRIDRDLEDEARGAEAVLLALAATAQHAIAGGRTPELIVGHGVLGRLLARLTIAAGAAAPVVWERQAARRDGALGYSVVDPAHDDRRDYASIYDVSGDPAILDTLVARLGRGGEIVLAGFYDQPLSFAFPPAFMREARIRIAAEWQPLDLVNVQGLVAERALTLDGLITHTKPAAAALEAYETAFDDPECLKMILDWRECP